MVATVRSYLPDVDYEPIREAFELADTAHAAQKRASGEPYILHPLAVAQISAELEMDVDGIIAALLHDVVEDTDYTLEDIRILFGEEVAFLVDGVTKLGQMDYKTKEDRQLESYRKMFLAMAKDVRVVVIKLADRLHNMRTLSFMREEKQKRIARETLEIFAPLAHRLGIFNIKWELEDLSFRYLEPLQYYDLVEQMKVKRQAREEIVMSTIDILRKELEKAHIEAEISGRPKHFYSIYKKLRKKKQDLSEIYDLYATRIIVNTVQDCYAVLGIVHSLWTPLPYRFKDYIAMPKQNMYQSLHTTVIGTQGQPVEIQIRTHEMHQVAEYGVAAHWRYKEGGRKAADQDFDEKVGWLRKLLEWQDTSNPKEFVDSLKLDVFADEVFVFTPQGDVIGLPQGSIPLDFAYRIHTEVGHRCIGAKVNGKMVPIDHKLQNGDIVTIITAKTGRPSLDWLNIVAASESRAKIRNWFKKANREENIAKAKEALESEAKKQGYDWKVLNKPGRLEALAEQLHAGTVQDMLAATGYGGITVKGILVKLIDAHKKEEAKENPLPSQLQQTLDSLRVHKTAAKGNGGILVKGEPGLLVHMARCCNPVPGDAVIGFITRGRGVSVHRLDCINVVNNTDPARLIEVSWQYGANETFLVVVEIEAYDRTALLEDIWAIMSEMKISIGSINADLPQNKIAKIRLGVQIKDLQQLDYVMTKLRRVKDIYSVRRLQTAGGS
ncbi:MAG: bifunctional (p)ppGpp synthetase/guanosine-3',5'-bis(diphosphate) 3'-pyrophosphohydrolase [Veillonellaceae bacterium]|nr:bifunctional (p)ppGpp synthetase/guanosine-3',5'-bis(diphosphate) 3'-pyrophosphohydrolase [Veillonellaceae bacterium]